MSDEKIVELMCKATLAENWFSGDRRLIMRAALAALRAAGYEVVPNAHNMTEEMAEAFFKAWDEYEQLKADKVFPRPSLPAYIYRAMLAASQEG